MTEVRPTEISSMRIHPTLHISHGYDHPRPEIIMSSADEKIITSINTC